MSEHLAVEVLPKETGRRCGDCQLCCKLLPVGGLGKRDGERCKYQRTGKGCTVYRKLEQIAPECRLWNCRWLVDQSCASMQRPDRSHYVIDVLPDFIAQETPEGTRRYPIVQVWCDPAFPDAHRDPHLREWLEATGQLALVRYSARDAFVLAPPSRSDTRQWHEHRNSTAAGEYDTWPDHLRDGMKAARARREARQ